MNIPEFNLLEIHIHAQLHPYRFWNMGNRKWNTVGIWIYCNDEWHVPNYHFHTSALLAILWPSQKSPSKIKVQDMKKKKKKQTKIKPPPPPPLTPPNPRHTNTPHHKLQPFAVSLSSRKTFPKIKHKNKYHIYSVTPTRHQGWSFLCYKRM